MASNPLVTFHLSWSKDTRQPYTWRACKGTDGDNLAYGETYHRHADAVHCIGLLLSGNCRYSHFKGGDGHWYFHVVGLNGEKLARSAFRYVYDTKCITEMLFLKDNAPKAVWYDHTKAA